MGYDTYWNGRLVPNASLTDEQYKELAIAVKNSDIGMYGHDRSGEINIDGSTRQDNDSFLEDLIAMLEAVHGITYSGKLSAFGEDDTDQSTYTIKENKVLTDETKSMLSIMVKDSDRSFCSEMIHYFLDVPLDKREFIQKFLSAYIQSDMKEIIEEWAVQSMPEEKSNDAGKNTGE